MGGLLLLVVVFVGCWGSEVPSLALELSSSVCLEVSRASMPGLGTDGSSAAATAVAVGEKWCGWGGGAVVM